jgi:hypothetical protein
MSAANADHKRAIKKIVGVTTPSNAMKWSRPDARWVLDSLGSAASKLNANGIKKPAVTAGRSHGTYTQAIGCNA